jgi:hypothetical protein
MNKTEKFLKKKFDLLPQGELKMQEETYIYTKKTNRYFIRIAEVAACLCIVCGIIFGLSYLKNEKDNTGLSDMPGGKNPVINEKTVENLGVSDDYKLYKVPISANVLGVKNIIQDINTQEYYTLSKGEITPFNVTEINTECEFKGRNYKIDFAYGTLEDERVIVPSTIDSTAFYHFYDEENVWVESYPIDWETYEDGNHYPFLYNINTGETTDILDGIIEYDNFNSINFSPDGNYALLYNSSEKPFILFDIRNNTFRDVAEMTGIDDIHGPTILGNSSFIVIKMKEAGQILYNYNFITGELKEIYSGSYLLSAMGDVYSENPLIGVTMNGYALFKNGDKYKIDDLEGYGGLWFYPQGKKAFVHKNGEDFEGDFISMNQFAFIDFETMQTKLIPRDDFEITEVTESEYDDYENPQYFYDCSYNWLSENEVAVSQENGDVIYVYDFSVDNSEQTSEKENTAETAVRESSQLLAEKRKAEIEEDSDRYTQYEIQKQNETFTVNGDPRYVPGEICDVTIGDFFYGTYSLEPSDETTHVSVNIKFENVNVTSNQILDLERCFQLVYGDTEEKIVQPVTPTNVEGLNPGATSVLPLQLEFNPETSTYEGQLVFILTDSFTENIDLCPFVLEYTAYPLYAQLLTSVVTKHSTPLTITAVF